MRLIISFIFSLALLPSAFAQQNFSCNYGSRGACLGYGDKIVDQGSVCFGSNTCDFRGFICKTKFDDVVDEYDTLVRKYNDLSRKHQELATAASSVSDSNSTLVSNYNDLLSKYRLLRSEYDSQSAQLKVALEMNLQQEATLRTLSNRLEQQKKR